MVHLSCSSPPPRQAVIKQKTNKQTKARARAKTAPVTKFSHTECQLPCVPVGANNTSVQLTYCVCQGIIPDPRLRSLAEDRRSRQQQKKKKSRIKNNTCRLCCFYPAERALFTPQLCPAGREGLRLNLSVLRVEFITDQLTKSNDLGELSVECQDDGRAELRS